MRGYLKCGCVQNVGQSFYNNILEYNLFCFDSIKNEITYYYFNSLLIYRLYLNLISNVKNIFNGFDSMILVCIWNIDKLICICYNSNINSKSCVCAIFRVRVVFRLRQQAIDITSRYKGVRCDSCFLFLYL